MTNRRDAVDEQVGEEGATRERPSPSLEQEQANQDEQFGAGLVELRGVERNPQWRADVGAASGFVNVTAHGTSVGRP